MIKVKMLPHISHFRSEESGIKRVVEAYFKYLPDYDIELVDPDINDYDLLATHAGMGETGCDVAHLHGLYWTADYDAPKWEYHANKKIVETIRNAKQITVPSNWVAETFQRDMRLNPHVIGHGIEWQEWQHKEINQGYVLWNKNRVGDVCDPSPLYSLASRFSEINFVSTFGENTSNNIHVFGGIIPHEDMKKLIQQSGIYLSTTKETFGIGVLEAMTAGVPVLGWNVGGNIDLIQHGINGYLAEYGNLEDLAEGLIYCFEHRRTLGDNGIEMSKVWTWQDACEKVAGVYRLALEDEPVSVSVVIPVYNKPVEQVKRAIDSCLNQTQKPSQIVIVDDGSTNETIDNLELSEFIKLIDDNLRLTIHRQHNQGVANARNNGIALTNSKYICCLDADDWISPDFLQICVEELEQDRALGVAYTGLKWFSDNGESGISAWPADWDFDRQVNYTARQNQIPTCNVFRREMWQRLGGYRQRYAPNGAGAEDAEFWTRAGAYGWKAKQVTKEPLFNYYTGGTVGGNKDYQEPDWLAWHSWSKDQLHPFASYATPINNVSHPVRQYDEPVISVVIPVGEGHEKDVINALDSLEAQTFRKWEVIVVDDTKNIEGNEWYDLIHVYPYVKFVNTPGNKGAGFARNRGVKLARAPFLLFLDADDTLHPEALQKMLNAYSETKEGIYTDYVGQAYIDEELASELNKKKRLQSFNSKTGEAIITYKAFDFDCEKALKQPDNPPYIWNLITTLIPTQWHKDIGGFDESMQTWEDWDYWLRMVQAGKCFTRLPEELVRYRFYTGQRRNMASADTEHGRQTAQTMIKYLQDKYKDIKNMGCGCKGKKVAQTMAALNSQQTVMEANNLVTDNNFVKAKYIGRRGNHHIIGAFEFNNNPGLPNRRRGNKWVLYYGYGQTGLETLVHVEDLRLMVGKWERMVQVEVPEIKRPEIKPPEPLKTKPLPELLNEIKTSQDISRLPGVTPAIAKKLKAAGYDTPEKIKQAGMQIVKIKGLAEKKAKIILKAVE